jgi:hypothetical protein
LSERGREQRARHSSRLEARDDGPDDTDGEHAAKHHVGVVALGPDDANRSIHPDENECSRERNADGGSVRGTACLPRQELIGDTSAGQQSAKGSEVKQVPDHLIGDLHRA